MPRGAKSQKAMGPPATVGGLVENSGADMGTFPPNSNLGASTSVMVDGGVRGARSYGFLDIEPDPST